MTMIERMARVAGEAVTESTKGLVLDSHTLEAAMRAALTVARVPTEEMVEAFRKAERGCTGPRDWVIRQAWPFAVDAAMGGAALNEKAPR